jgi:hypothetical protein
MLSKFNGIWSKKENSTTTTTKMSETKKIMGLGYVVPDSWSRHNFFWGCRLTLNIGCATGQFARPPCRWCTRTCIEFYKLNSLNHKITAEMILDTSKPGTWQTWFEFGSNQAVFCTQMPWWCCAIMGPYIAVLDPFAWGIVLLMYIETSGSLYVNQNQPSCCTEQATLHAQMSCRQWWFEMHSAVMTTINHHTMFS